MVYSEVRYNSRKIKKRVKRLPNTKKQILLIDEQPICRYGLERILNQSTEFKLVGYARSLDEIATPYRAPDLIAIDIIVARSNGIAALKELRRRFKKSAILVITAHDETLFAERCLRAGAQGYLMKTAPETHFFHAISNVSRGQIYLSPNMKTLILSRIGGEDLDSSSSRFDRLSDRELLIVQHISQSMDNREIATNMKISIKTIESHRSRIKSKLELSSPSELVRFAMRLQKSAI